MAIGARDVSDSFLRPPRRRRRRRRSMAAAFQEIFGETGHHAAVKDLIPNSRSTMDYDLYHRLR